MLDHQITMNFSIYTDLYEKLIPQNHLLRQLNEMVDFSFIEAELEDNYSLNMGRKAVPPIQMFKYLLLKAIYCLSDRDLIERARYDMSFKYFLGLSPEDDVIHESLLAKFRTQRIKDTKILDLLLKKICGACYRKGCPDQSNHLCRCNTYQIQIQISDQAGGFAGSGKKIKTYRLSD